MVWLGNFYQSSQTDLQTVVPEAVLVSAHQVINGEYFHGSVPAMAFACSWAGSCNQGREGRWLRGEPRKGAVLMAGPYTKREKTETRFLLPLLPLYHCHPQNTKQLCNLLLTSISHFSSPMSFRALPPLYLLATIHKIQTTDSITQKKK